MKTIIIEKIIYHCIFHNMPCFVFYRHLTSYLLEADLIQSLITATPSLNLTRQASFLSLKNFRSAIVIHGNINNRIKIFNWIWLDGIATKYHSIPKYHGISINIKILSVFVHLQFLLHLSVLNSHIYVRLDVSTSQNITTSYVCYG